MSALAVLRSSLRAQRVSSRTSSLAPSLSSRTLLASRWSLATRAQRCYSTAEQKPAEDTPKAESSSSEPAKDAGSEQEKVIAAKDAEIAELTSRLRYAQADFLNLQRISEREKASAKEFAITRFASDILSTADVLALALSSVPTSSLPSTPDLAKLFEGVELTQRQLLQTLAHHGVTPYDPIGEVFDPNRHEALYTAPAPPGKEPGTIIQVQKVGYMIKDRTLRAPQVGVAQDAA